MANNGPNYGQNAKKMAKKGVKKWQKMAKKGDIYLLKMATFGAGKVSASRGS